MTSHFDTIVASITGTQKAAVAVVRISGPDSWEIGRKVFREWPPHPQSHRAIYGKLVTGDEGLALPFAEGHSYTGEESVEFSIHGSPMSVKALIEAILHGGARLAGPGEFTQRAFLNGRIDLTQAEAVRDTVEALTDSQMRQANLHRDGTLRREIGQIRDSILGLITSVEASVDFSEEIGPFDREHGAKLIGGTLDHLDRLLNTATAGRILREGIRIVLAGPPNAGKSSLLNALLGTDRSIVTEVAGTTRDYIEEEADLGGIHCVLYDTAGLRETSDHVESIGVARTQKLAANADWIWYLYDSSIGWAHSDNEAVESFGRPVQVLANKCDLAHSEPGLPISAVTREGLEALRGLVAKKIAGAETQVFINSRHEPIIRRAEQDLTNSLAAIENGLPDDLISVGLRSAYACLGEISGDTASPDVIDRIFRDFCIGK